MRGDQVETGSSGSHVGATLWYSGFYSTDAWMSLVRTAMARRPVYRRSGGAALLELRQGRALLSSDAELSHAQPLGPAAYMLQQAWILGG